MNDLVKFHSIRGSWDLNEKALGRDESDGGTAVVNAENVDSDAEVVDVEIKETHSSGISTGSSPVIPSSAVVSDFTNDDSLPPTSDTDAGFADEPDMDVGMDVRGVGEQHVLKRKHSAELGIEVVARWKVAKREEAEILLSDDGGVKTDDENKRSRSANASRKLKSLARSGDFTIDERKRERFEGKCVEMDGSAQFRYQGASWQVLHSRCLGWYRMSEPYNTTKFKQHVETCKAKGEMQNLSITNFFKPKDPNSTNTGAKSITASGRKQIFIRGSTSTSPVPLTPHINSKLTIQNQPCCGISDVHNPLISTYISRTVVEGAGSISLQKAAKMVYGDDTEYSKLTESQRETVAITQSHLRSWSINRERRVVFSTNCKKFIEPGKSLKTLICNDCETVLRSDAFKQVLRVKPPLLERMKFIPLKYRGPLEDLGVKFAGIHGLSTLLQEVSSI